MHLKPPYRLSFGPLILVALSALAFWITDSPSNVLSPNSLELQRTITEHPNIPDSDNAFIFFLGLNVKRGEDPTRIGAIRLARANAQISAGEYETEYRYDKFRGTIFEQIYDNTALSECITHYISDCVATLLTDFEATSAWLEETDWIRQRYAKLIEHQYWRSKLVIDINASLPPYMVLSHLHRHWLAGCLKLARQGKFLRLREALNKDLQFWRRMLTNADTLMAKMVATASIQIHFRWSNAIFSKLVSAPQKTLSNSWKTPFSKQERSMRLALSGEWIGRHNNLQQLAKKPNYLAEILEFNNAYPLVPKTVWRFLANRFTPEVVSNKLAEYYISAAQILDQPYQVAADILPKVNALNNEFYPNTWYSKADPYRPLYLGTTQLDIYTKQVMDLEGLRRISLLAAQIQEQGTKDSEIKQWLQKSSIISPYPSRPFQWEETSKALVFHGLAQKHKLHLDQQQ